MTSASILEELFDPKILTIIRFFLSNKNKDYFLQEISKETKVPLATVFRITHKLVLLKVIMEVKIKKFKMYRCIDNDHIKFLESFVNQSKQVLEKFVGYISKFPGVAEVILYGEEADKKANILLIGTNVSTADTKRLTAAFKEEYDYTITLLTLDRAQYSQMIQMGLYSGKKTVLFRA